MKKQKGKTSFRARLQPADIQPRMVFLNWKTSLSTRVGGNTWVISSLSSARVDTPQRVALTRLIRRVTKKKGQLQIVTHPGASTTSKSLGTRMGNGKGKVVNHRRWWSHGFIFARVITPTQVFPRWLGILNTRCGASLAISRVGY